MNENNPYRILGLSLDATNEKIEQAYREALRKHEYSAVLCAKARGDLLDSDRRMAWTSRTLDVSWWLREEAPRLDIGANAIDYLAGITFPDEE